MNGTNYRRSPGWGMNFASTMVGRLILINVGVFLIQNVVPAFNAVFALSPRFVVQNFFVWQLVTYMFLHGSIMHLLFNMFVLWMFGTAVESVWGARQFLRYYIICGIGGSVGCLLFNYNAVIIGASGAIFGIYVAYAMMFPDSRIYIYFLFPVKAKYLVTALAVIQLANGISGPSGIAYFAHLGGIVTGLLFFKNELLRRAKFSMGTKRRWKAHVSEPRERTTDQETDNIDSILDKISAKGYDNLSSIEKRILENYSRKHREKNE